MTFEGRSVQDQTIVPIAPNKNTLWTVDTYICTVEERLLVFTVLAVVILSTFTGVAVGRARFADTCGNVLTRIELTSVHTLLTKETYGTDREEEMTPESC